MVRRGLPVLNEFTAGRGGGGHMRIMFIVLNRPQEWLNHAGFSVFRMQMSCLLAGRIAPVPICSVRPRILRIAGRTQDNEPIFTHIAHLDRGTGRMSGRQGEAGQGSRGEGAMAWHASMMRTQMRTHRTCMQVVQNLYQCEPRMLWS